MRRPERTGKRPERTGNEPFWAAMGLMGELFEKKGTRLSRKGAQQSKKQTTIWKRGSMSVTKRVRSVFGTPEKRAWA